MKDDFAFVEYANVKSASEAIKEMRNYELNGQRLMVEEARPKEYESITYYLSFSSIQ